MTDKTPNHSQKSAPAPGHGSAKTEQANIADIADPARSKLLTNISHELRTPMDAILGYAELLADTPLDDTQQNFVNAIERAARGLLDIMDDVLNLSRMDAGKLVINRQPFSIHDSLDSVSQLLAPSAYHKGLDFVRLIDADVPLNLIGDPLRIRQILVNLVGNAVKFTETGEIRLRVSAKPMDGNRHELTVSISDTGMGITSDEMTRLFEPFSQPARPQGDIAGTGLGLVISKALCTTMGGSISVQSTAGSGSEFTVRIPLESMLEESFRTGESTNLLAGRAIVIICPDPDQAGWIGENLRLDGARIRFATSLQELASTVSSDQCSDDIALTVINAQNLVNLEHLAQAWRPAHGHLPVLNLVSAVSGHALQRVCGAMPGDAIPAHSSTATVSHHVAALIERRGTTRQKRRSERDSVLQPLAGLRLLVAEDNQFSRDYLQMLLSRNGATVDVCRDGNDACDMVAANHYDLVLMDVRMPHCDGIEATQKLRAAGGSLPPIIGLTAAPEECCKALNVGMTDCLLKPIRPALLLKYIKNHHKDDPQDFARPLSFIDDEMHEELNRELPHRAAELLNAIARGDMSSAIDAAHKINGAAALCGFTELHATAASIEGLIRQRRVEGIERLTRNLMIQVDQALASLSIRTDPG